MASAIASTPLVPVEAGKLESQPRLDDDEYDAFLAHNRDRVSLRRAPRPSGASAPPPEPAAAGTSFMITRAQEEALRQLGYTDEQIREMTPKEAHRILADQPPQDPHSGPGPDTPDDDEDDYRL